MLRDPGKRDRSGTTKTPWHKEKEEKEWSFHTLVPSRLCGDTFRLAPYGSLHFITYVYLDQFFAFDEIIKDVAKRPFITVGFTAFVLMIRLP